MLYLESTGIAHCCNDVEAHGGVNAEMFYVSIGCYDNTAYFLPVDGILRLDVFRVTSGFYFYDNQSVVLGGNNVQFMDVMMPNIDGLEATRIIRGQKRADARTIGIVALSVNVFAEDVQRTRAAGMNEQLTKPLNTEKMLRTIARYRRC